MSACITNHNDDTIITSDTIFMKNIPLTLFERVVWERELETEQNCNISTPTLLAISAFLSRSPGLLNQGPGGTASLCAGFLYCILSPTCLIPNSQSGAWGLPLLGAGFLYHIFSNWSGLQTNWLPVFNELNNSSTPTQYLPITGHWNMHFRRLWNGMFDHHQVEITVMQFTGHSLPVHQFVTVPRDFNPVLYCQPSPPTPM